MAAPDAKITTFVLAGASGDLAKKKIYPVLWNLYLTEGFDRRCIIVGYARSDLKQKGLVDRIRPFLEKKVKPGQEELFEEFLKKCLYTNGPYDKPEGFAALDAYITEQEALVVASQGAVAAPGVSNRVYYLALPPSVFAPVTKMVRENCWSKTGWNRMIVEKPFGKDSASSQVLSDHLKSLFDESQIYRIDHYLGKEMVQNLFQMRFANLGFSSIWNRDNIASVQFTFKEPFGTGGRGGYFDQFGIIRDILQNHLLQVLCVAAMEPPSSTSADHVRDEKVKVLRAVKPLTVNDVVIGQYYAAEPPIEGDDDSKNGYLDDDGVPNDSVTPTFAAVRLNIANERWDGVPFIMRAGKALNERKAEVRIQFKDVPGNIFGDEFITPRNELVLRIQPNEAIWLKMVGKKPGMSFEPVSTYLDLTYGERFEDFSGVEAYERLILEVCHGNQANFVRSDELFEAWRIFTPLLHKLEKDRVPPIKYMYGSRGPAAFDKMMSDAGYVFFPDGAEGLKKSNAPAAVADIGMIGLAVMGQNIVLNMNDHGFVVCAFNRTTSKVDAFLENEAKGTKVVGSHSIEEFVSKLKKPRRAMMLVKAGAVVDANIQALLPFLEQGDIIIDGGNSQYDDSNRRAKDLASKGIVFIGCGVSGGEEGARYGPSMMPGGNIKGWPFVKSIFQSICAKSNGEPCCDWVGPEGAGHYTKMVHNGIEYGDMQVCAESYHMMKDYLGLSCKEMAAVFADWNKGELDSFLVEITANILAYEEGGEPLVEKIRDAAGQKGTGKWTAISALDQGIPLTLVGESVFARCLSAIKEERVGASKMLTGPTGKFSGNKAAFIEDLRQALYASKIVSYAQGFSLLRAAAAFYSWDLNYPAIALMWRGGCIIRSVFLGNIKDAFTKNPGLTNLLLDDFFHAAIDKAQPSWRRVCAASARSGIPVPSYSAALAYYDGYRCAQLPANLIQAQRDYFGAHTYQLAADGPDGKHIHTNWTGRGGNVSSSTYNA